MNMNKSKKRDRWASSSDEEDDSKKIKSQTNYTANNKVSSRQTVKNHSVTLPNPTSSTLNNIDNDTKLAANTIEHNHLSDDECSEGYRSVYDTYEKLKRISEGSYGIVWKARCLKPLNSSTASN